MFYFGWCLHRWKALWYPLLFIFNPFINWYILVKAVWNFRDGAWGGPREQKKSEPDSSTSGTATPATPVFPPAPPPPVPTPAAPTTAESKALLDFEIDEVRLHRARSTKERDDVREETVPQRSLSGRFAPKRKDSKAHSDTSSTGPSSDAVRQAANDDDARNSYESIPLEPILEVDETTEPDLEQGLNVDEPLPLNTEEVVLPIQAKHILKGLYPDILKDKPVAHRQQTNLRTSTTQESNSRSPLTGNAISDTVDAKPDLRNKGSSIEAARRARERYYAKEANASINLRLESSAPSDGDKGQNSIMQYNTGDSFGAAGPAPAPFALGEPLTPVHSNASLFEARNKLKKKRPTEL